MKYLFILLSLMFLSARPVTPGFDIGDTATDFQLKNVDGKMISMADYPQAKGFILVFDSNTCPYSRAYNGRIAALHKKYAAAGFPLLVINSNDPVTSPGDSYDEMVRIAQKKQYGFPYLMDESQQIARTYGATNTPHVYVLVRKGPSLKVAYIGTIDDNPRNEKNVTRRYVEEAVDALLSGHEVKTGRTKAIGCGIKWKNA